MSDSVPGVTDLLDPEIAAALTDLPDLSFTAEGLPVIRPLVPRPDGPGEGIERSDHVVDDGPVELTVHRPRGLDGLLPCVYWIHGGGLMIGHRDMDDDDLERWCRSFGCACVSIEYRLAPEHPYPTALEDCHRGLAWLTEHADDLGIDTARIGVGGRSAGGGLAAALTMLVRDHSGARLRFQILDCPMLDDRPRWPSRRMAGVPVWSRESNDLGWHCYLGDRCGTADVPALAAPARATDLGGLPPAFVAVGAVDVLRDEAVDYATRLNQAGVPSELHVYAGAPHGALLFPAAAVTRRMVVDIDDFVGRSIARS
jgi:acetyl esterase/lipase